MSTEKRLDIVLKYLNNDIENFEDFKKIKSNFEYFKNKELDLILDKLFLDGYINKKKSTMDNANKILPPSYYRITYHGLLFISRGGYQHETKTRNYKNIWLISKTVANLINAIAILVIASLGVFVSYESKVKDKIIDDQKIKLYEQIFIVDSLKSLTLKQDSLFKSINTP